MGYVPLAWHRHPSYIPAVAKVAKCQDVLMGKVLCPQQTTYIWFNIDSFLAVLATFKLNPFFCSHLSSFTISPKNRPPSHRWTVQWNEFFELCSREVGELVLETWTEWFGTKKNHLERPLDFLHNKNQKFQEITWTCSLHNSWMSCFFLGTFLLKGLRRCQIWETNSRPRRSAKNHSAGEKHLQTGKLVDLNESHVNVSIP